MSFEQISSDPLKSKWETHSCLAANCIFTILQKNLRGARQSAITKHLSGAARFAPALVSLTRLPASPFRAKQSRAECMRTRMTTSGPRWRNMTTSNLPVSLITSACIPPLGCEPPQARARLRQVEVVARAQAGDHDAFTELYLEHKRRVFSICMRMVRDFALAEDLTQEAFLQVHRRISLFRGDSAFTTWLHRLTVNTVLMYLRKHALSVVSLDLLMEDIPDERAGRSFGVRDLTQAGVVDRLAIDRALATMAPGYRSIFLLHDIQGFDHPEIASILKCTRGNTKSQLHKARRVLRGALSPIPNSTHHSTDLFLVSPRTTVPKKRAPKHNEAPLRA